ncbi:DNA-directed RNA polymerase III, subunit Rpc31 [Peziza echinospora]|nr:DNA-directed RNA polymerase III, subunit Rpc31 [Peziza echinospora]
MSRGGGRGGRGGGRGGFGGGGGRDMPFEVDPNLKPDFAPSELFPPNPPPIQSALSKEERAYVARFREFREKVCNGPFYTVLGKKRGLENPFEEVERFSRKYERKKRKAPKLDAIPYVIEFFPPELHSTLDPTNTTNQASAKSKPAKRLYFSTLDTFADELTSADNILLNDDEDDETKPKNEENEGDEDTGAKDEDDDEEEEDEEDEDQFQDDMEGDYNAEQYFEDGEGDGWGEDGGDDDMNY